MGERKRTSAIDGGKRDAAYPNARRTDEKAQYEDSA